MPNLCKHCCEGGLTIGEEYKPKAPGRGSEFHPPAAIEVIVDVEA